MDHTESEEGAEFKTIKSEYTVWHGTGGRDDFVSNHGGELREVCNLKEPCSGAVTQVLPRDVFSNDRKVSLMFHFDARRCL